jgi:hypothetical protein
MSLVMPQKHPDELYGNILSSMFLFEHLRWYFPHLVTIPKSDSTTSYGKISSAAEWLYDNIGPRRYVIKYSSHGNHFYAMQSKVGIGNLRSDPDKTGTWISLDHSFFFYNSADAIRFRLSI